MAYVADHLSVAALEERHWACEDVMSSRSPGGLSRSGISRSSTCR